MTRPLPATDARLGVPLRLERLQLVRAAPDDPDAAGDPYGLWLFLEARPGGIVRLVLHGDLCRAALEPLWSRATPTQRPWGPVTSEEAGTLLALVATVLEDLGAGHAVQIRDVCRSDTTASGAPASPRGTPAETRSPWSLRCETRWAVGAASGQATAWLDAEATHWLRQASEATPPAVSEASARALPVPLSLVVASARIPANQAAQLEPGDVVLFEGCPPADRSALPVHLASGAWRLGCRLERTATGRQLVISGAPGSPMESPCHQAAEGPPEADPGAAGGREDPSDETASEPTSGPRQPTGSDFHEPPSRAAAGDRDKAKPSSAPPASHAPPHPGMRPSISESPMAEPPADTSAESPISRAHRTPTAPRSPGSTARLSEEETRTLERLSVDLEVVLGQVTLSAAEAARLQPGAVVTLPQAVGDPVILQSGGTPIARAELVEVEGSLGVRILALLR